MKDRTDRNPTEITHQVFAAIVLIASLVIYLLTVQRTLSLWDCGEFIACSYILGVAHPPGTPLFLLIGRIFSLLPLAADISLRINLLSVASGAAAAMFAYLVAVRLMFHLPGVRSNRGRRLAAYFSATTGALLFAFSRTNWSNSVEAEVYSLSMLLTFLIIWLSLRWYEARGSNIACRYLILIAYLGVMGIGIHMTVFLVLPAVFLFIVLADESLRRDPRFWITAGLLFLVTVDVLYFFFAVVAWLLISLVAYHRQKAGAWALTLLISAAALTGYSCHAYIPIRASESPSINENDPDNLKKFVDYIARKQYGSESMFKKMFSRRAYWANQFGDFPRMGFGGFLLEQYGMSGIAFLLPLVLVIIGIIALIKWRWKLGIFLTLMLLLFTVGLVLYMNFADGSRIDPLTLQDKLEVRDRDYFFTPGFVLFGLCIGLGAFVVINGLISLLERTGATPVAVAGGLISFLLPAAALTSNFNSCDRSGNYVPYNYAFNVLESCPQDAILFTSGDNDTFPVWCLQEVYGIRKDVRVVNLSLLQIDWYQLQMKYEKGVPISFTDEQMIWVENVDPRTGRKQYHPAVPYEDRLRGWTHPLVAFQDQNTGRLVSVAHQMIENIIATNNWKYPILFANAYPPEVAYPLGEHIKRRGSLFELVRERSSGEFDRQLSLDLFNNTYLYTGLADPQVYREEVATSLVIGDIQTMMELAAECARAGDTASALELTMLGVEKTPEFWQPYARQALYADLDSATVDSLFDRYFEHLDSLQDHNPDNVYYYQYRGMADQYLGDLSGAIAAYEKSYEINPAISITYRSLLSVYVQADSLAAAFRISKEFLKTNPLDQTAQSIINRGL